jgi:uncharacterized protein DUF2380
MLRLLLAAAIAIAGASAAQAGPKTAIFPFELIDVSLPGQYIGPDPNETQRLALITEELRKLAARDAGYEVLDLSGIAPDIAKAAPLYKCNGCDIALARKVGADIAIMGTVRKVSNLVLEVHLFVSDVASGKLTKIHRVELRGNSDETWLRGVRRLVAEHLGGGSESKQSQRH